jgi:hypothetical protein
MKLPRNAELWLMPYLIDRTRALFSKREVKRVWVAITDHYEPLWNGADLGKGLERVALWLKHWPEIASKVGPDSSGRLPRYSFFFPQDEYHPALVDPLAELAQRGLSDVEIHIHHDGEGRQAFIDKMSTYCETLHNRHGLLRKVNGQIVFGFIHGNWALDNSRPDGRWCGLNDELQILRDLGCYADFTMPAGAHPSQAKTINQIYWAIDDPKRPKSYDFGVPLRAARETCGDLLMITGPFGLRWRERMLPRIETGEIAGYDIATPERTRCWFELAPMIGNDLFIKLFAHGTQERNSGPMLLQHNLLALYHSIAQRAVSIGAEFRFVTAYEMYQAVLRAAAPNHNEKATPYSQPEQVNSMSTSRGGSI